MKVVTRKPLIAVIGAGSCDEGIYALAEEVGKEIAIREGIVVCGGLYGVMEACCKGAKEANGLTIGILPGNGIDEANQYVDIPIATGQGIGRNSIIAHTGRAAIAVNGKYGTLSEIGYFLQLGKPVIGLDTWEVSDDITRAGNPIEAVETAFDFLSKK
ncbi:MAG: TIGR00725 family protein [bacterium]|nr:TIGR00725 family protein [bacterium]